MCHIQFSNIKKLFASNNEAALRGDRDNVHPSMITKDDLFLSGGVFASGGPTWFDNELCFSIHYSLLRRVPYSANVSPNTMAR